MGCGMSTEEKEGKQRNEEIENQLKRDKMLQRNEIKMLLLGQYLQASPHKRSPSNVLQELVNPESPPSLSR
jgi:lipoate synthase